MSRRCILCGGNEGRVVHHIGAYRIVGCSRCALQWSEGPPISPGEFYDADYFVGDDSSKGYADYHGMDQARVRLDAKRLKTLRRAFPRAESLLEVGCGCGGFLARAGQAGLQAVGVDVSAYAAEYARQVWGQRVVTGEINAATLDEAGRRFDLIALWDVIEHLPDPCHAVALLADRLRPGGVLAVSTGDVSSLVAKLSGPRWHLYNLPEHLWFFSAASLQRLLERAGLIVHKRCCEVGWYPLRYLFERGAFKFPVIARWAGRMARSRLGRISVPMTLFDVVTVYAVKPAESPDRLFHSASSSGVENTESDMVVVPVG